MKKILKFAFAIVAMASVVFASASCGKEDNNSIIEGVDAFVDNDPYFDYCPKFKEFDLPFGYQFDIEWTMPAPFDTTTFRYQLCYSEDNENWIELPIQDSTIYHWSLKTAKLKFDTEYYFKVFAYHWFRGLRRRACIREIRHTIFYTNLKNFVYKINDNNSMYINLTIAKHISNDSIVVTACNLDENENITKIFKKETFKIDTTSRQFFLDRRDNNIENEWDNYINFVHYLNGDTNLVWNVKFDY